MTSKILSRRAGRISGTRAGHDTGNGHSARSGIPGFAGRNTPHPRGGDHRQRHGRDGNPKG